MTWQSFSAETMQSILAALLVLFAPGIIWLAWSRTGRRDAVEHLADAAALSFALITVGAALAALFKLKFTPELFAGLGGFGIGLLLFGLLTGFVTHRYRWTRRGLFLLLAGLLVLGLVAAWRLFQARNLLLPAWVDSVHHTLIVQKFIDAAGLPATLAPELNVPFDYHYGFHAAAALFAVVADQTPADAVLWFGQITNALIALSAYRLSKSFFGDWRKAAFAALLVGFVFQMPAYYVSWGRYTLSAGLVLLGPAMAAALEVSRVPSHRPDQGKLYGWGRLLILTSAILLAHYMTAVLLAEFLLLLGGGRLAQSVAIYIRTRRGDDADALNLAKTLLRRFGMLVSAVLLGVLLVLPRLWGVLQAFQSGLKVSAKLPIEGYDAGYLSYTLKLLGPQHNHLLLIVAGVLLLLAIWRKPQRPAALWAAVMLLLALPWSPQFGPFRTDLMAIVLFLPAALLLGEAIPAGADALACRTRGWLGLAAGTLALALLLFWGLKETRNVLNQGTQFVNSGDMTAIEWIEQNTPADARFYINVSGWQGTTYRGVDGGYWLLPLTRRAAWMPPVLYTWMGPEEVVRMKNAADKAQTVTTCNDDFWSIMDQMQLNYVYIKEGVGALQPQGLQNCPGLIQVYHRDGIALYEVVDP